MKRTKPNQHRETRIMSKEDATSFKQNMAWFAGYGRITADKLTNGMYQVSATKAAWQNWAG